MRYITSIERMGIKKGRREGRQEEAKRLLQRLLQKRFDSVPTELQVRLPKLSVKQLEELLDVALTVESLEQLEAHLSQLSGWI